MRYNELLLEDLGNLSKLKVGNLINVLKQSNNKYSFADEKRFTNKHIFGSTSEISEFFPLKDGLASLRKLYRSQEIEPAAFALYLGEDPVAFGVYSAYDLAGTKRDGNLAWDLKKYNDIIDKDFQAKVDAEKSDWSKKSLQSRGPDIPASSAREKEEKNYIGYGKYSDPIIKKSTGQIKTVEELKEVFGLIIRISKEINQPLQAKLVYPDIKAREKRSKRSDQHGVVDSLLVKKLADRLRDFRNAKRPTVDNILDFIKAVNTKATPSITFKGITYNLNAADPYGEKVSPSALLNGTPFSLIFKSISPDHPYDELKIKYKFHKDTNTIQPLVAIYHDPSKTDYHERSVEDPIDHISFMKEKLGVKELDKDSIIKSLLEKLKTKHFEVVLKLMNVLEKMDLAFPEYAAIRKSIAAEKAKTN